MIDARPKNLLKKLAYIFIILAKKLSNWKIFNFIIVFYKVSLEFYND